MTDRLLERFSAQFLLKSVDTGEFSIIKANGMTFHINRFEADGLGVVSEMTATGMAGLMKMETLIVNPIYRDAPLYSFDLINAMGRRTVIFELYDTLLGTFDASSLDTVKSKAAALPSHDTGKHWYDNIKLSQSFALRGGRKYAEDFDNISLDFSDVYLTCVMSSTECDAEKKRGRTSEYVEGLLSHGGPSTDAFKKAIGEEKTAKLFRTILF